MALFGLVLSGGSSSRMGRDKGAIVYPASRVSQREKCFELLKPYCEKVFVSCREEQRATLGLDLPVVIDTVTGAGPGVGILSADQAFPGHSWLVLACDFPWVSDADVRRLVGERAGDLAATYYRTFELNQPIVEPLFAIWESAAIAALRQDFLAEMFSPRRTLGALPGRALAPLSKRALRNVNTPADLATGN